MIRYMVVVVLARPIFCGVLARPILADIESGTRENEVVTHWSQIPMEFQSSSHDKHMISPVERLKDLLLSLAVELTVGLIVT
jgi:hypothetical protein